MIGWCFHVILREICVCGDGADVKTLVQLKKSQLNVSWFPTKCVMVEFIKHDLEKCVHKIYDFVLDNLSVDLRD